MNPLELVVVLCAVSSTFAAIGVAFMTLWLNDLERRVEVLASALSFTEAKVWPLTLEDQEDTK